MVFDSGVGKAFISLRYRFNTTVIFSSVLSLHEVTLMYTFIRVKLPITTQKLLNRYDTGGIQIGIKYACTLRE